MQDFMHDGIINEQEAEDLKREKVNVSNVMITIVYNATLYDQDSDKFKEFHEKFRKLGNFILNRPENVLRFVKRVNGGTGAGMFLNLPRENELPKIISIENQQGVVESTGPRGLRKMHVHLGFTVRHKTMIQGDDERTKFIAHKILGVPENFLHIKFRCSGGLESYIQKYVKK